MRVYCFAVFAIFLWWIPLCGIVIPPSSAGVVERQIENEYDVSEIPPDREVPLLDIDIPEKTYSLDDGEKIYISHINICGNTILSSDVLEQLLCPFYDRDLSMNEIHEICASLQRAFVCRGYFLARAYCPEQTIENGVLSICILEGILGNVSIRGNCFYKASFIKGYFNCLQGRPLNYNEILKTLFLLNENKKLSAGGIFKKGCETGTVDLIVEICDRRPIDFAVNTNNYGSSLNTRWRTGARLDYGNAVFNGDCLSATGVLGSPIKGLFFTNVYYKVPLNHYGAYLSGGYLHSSFRVDELRSLKLKGRTDIGTLRYDQALQRKRFLSTDLFVEFDIKKVQNFSLGETSSLDKLRVLIPGYSVDYTDRIRGRTLFTIDGHFGIPNFLGGSGSNNPKSSRKGAGGSFTYFIGDLTRIQGLFYDSFYLFHANGQYSFSKLPLSEQIYIGGVDTVRGYEPAIALGDSGYYINNEIRFPLPFIANYNMRVINKRCKDFLHLVGFVDIGQVFLRGGSTSNQLGSAFLAGTGCGLRAYGPLGIDISLDVAFPLTDKFKTQSPFTYFKVSWNLIW